MRPRRLAHQDHSGGGWKASFKRRRVRVCSSPKDSYGISRGGRNLGWGGGPGYWLLQTALVRHLMHFPSLSSFQNPDPPIRCFHQLRTIKTQFKCCSEIPRFMKNTPAKYITSSSFISFSLIAWFFSWFARRKIYCAVETTSNLLYELTSWDRRVQRDCLSRTMDSRWHR